MAKNHFLAEVTLREYSQGPYFFMNLQFAGKKITLTHFKPMFFLYPLQSSDFLFSGGTKTEYMT